MEKLKHYILFYEVVLSCSLFSEPIDSILLNCLTEEERKCTVLFLLKY